LDYDPPAFHKPGRPALERPLSPIHRKLLGLALRRPWLVPTLVGTAWAFRARGWHTRWPFLPLPSAEYMRWRMETAYGEPDAVPPDEDLERFVTWAAAMRRRP
jgi:hypothetical protein